MHSFGPFTIDSDERLLRRNSEVVSLPPKVIETLLLLLERPGELVTKEALRQRVWQGAFIEENSITQNISRLRRLFNPDFPNENVIVTVPKRGYRFTVAVTVLPVHGVDGSSVTDRSSSPLLDTTVVSKQLASSVAATEVTARRFPGIAVFVASLLLCCTAIAGWAWRHRHLAAPGKARPSLAILGFDDLSHQAETAWMGTALSEMMYSELAANQRLRLVPNGVVAQLQQSKPMPEIISLSPSMIDRVRENLNCQMVLLGHYLVSGGKVRVDVVLLDARTGETIAAVTRTDVADHLLSVVALMGQDLRQRLGTPGLSQQEQRQVVAAVATNPDAIRNYAQGLAELRLMDAAGAQPYLEQAIRLEPSYPMAHAALSQTWSLLGYDAKASEEAKLAVQLSAGISRDAQLEVEARYAEASSDWGKAIESYSALWQFYPDNGEYGLSLARDMIAEGKAQQALDVLEKLHATSFKEDMDPRIALTEARAQSALSRYNLSAKAADVAIGQARARQNMLVLATALLSRGAAANHVGDVNTARAAFTESAALAQQFGDRATEVRAMSNGAELLRQHGDIEGAKQQNVAAIAIARQIGDRQDLIELLLNMTQVYRPEGNLQMQKEFSQQALQLAKDTANKLAEEKSLLDLGNALNNLGDPDGARQAYQQCVDLARETGDKDLLSKALGNLGILEYTHGRLAQAQSLIQEGIAIARSTGEKASVAYKLGQYANVLMYEDRLPEARNALEERCRIVTQPAAKLDVAACRTSLAELAIAEGHPHDAIGPLIEITNTYKTINPALNAWNTLAQADLAVGDTGSMKEAIEHAEKLGGDTRNPAEFRIPMGLIIGRYQAATGHNEAALRTLRQSRDGATALQLVPIALRAKLYLAEIDARTAPAAGVRELQKVSDEAMKAGFLHIVSEAQAEERKHASR